MANVVTFLIVAVIVAAIMGAAKYLLICAALIVFALCVLVILEAIGKDAVKTIRGRRAARKAIAERADAQHQQVMRGDPSGIYGIYPIADLGDDTKI